VELGCKIRSNLYLALALLQIVHCQTAVLSPDTHAACVAAVGHRAEPDTVGQWNEKTQNTTTNIYQLVTRSKTSKLACRRLCSETKLLKADLEISASHKQALGGLID